IGEKCPLCGKVYVGSRGSCPTDGVPTEGEIEVPAKGTLTTFCVVNVQFAGQSVETPYASGYMLCDGADIALMGLLQEIPIGEVRLPAGPALRLRPRSRRRGSVAADRRVPRGDGWGVGPLRGVGPPAIRRHRHRPRLRLREVVARRHPPHPRPPARPVLPHASV